MALGKTPITRETFKSGLHRSSYSAGYNNGEDESVEDRINGLARVLGIPSKELASVVADAVRQYVPAAKETEKVVLKDEMPGVVEQVVNSFSGLDDELE